MNKRRSMSDALTMSPETQAFINGEEMPPQTPPKRRGRRPTEKTIDLSLSDNTDNASVTRAPRPVRGEVVLPNAHEVLDEVMVPLNARIPRRLMQALQRLHYERKLRLVKPGYIQDLVAAALEEWLPKQRIK